MGRDRLRSSQGEAATTGRSALDAVAIEGLDRAQRLIDYPSP